MKRLLTTLAAALVATVAAAPVAAQVPTVEMLASATHAPQVVPM